MDRDKFKAFQKSFSGRSEEDRKKDKKKGGLFSKLFESPTEKAEKMARRNRRKRKY